MDERQEIKSLKKALRALTFLNSHGESTVTQVAAGIGVPRTTAFRLLETLACDGFIQKQEHSNLYRLTSKVLGLSSGFGDADLIVEVAKPLIQEMGEKIGWPLALATPRGQDMVVRIVTDYDTTLAIDRYAIGFTTPMLHAPAGLCYLAFCDDDVRESVVQIAQSSAAVPEILHNGGDYFDYTLEQIRARGFSHIRFMEYREGGLAVPLVVGGRVVGGVVMRYIKSTLKTEQIESVYFPTLRQLTADISAAYEARISQRRLQNGGSQVPVPQTRELASTSTTHSVI
jgi:IclR family mhp operon transcriptional activator